MTEKPSSLYILKRNIYLFVYSNNKNKLVSVTKGKGRDGKKEAYCISQISHQYYCSHSKKLCTYMMKKLQ